MASSKSRKIKRKRTSKRKQKRFEGLKSKLERGPLRVQRFVVEPRGEAKMSEVLTDFVEPYRELADTEEAYRKLLTLAILAWNASFLPEKEQQEMVERVLVGGIPGATKELKAGLREIVSKLIARKKAYFVEYRRIIIDYELKDTGRGYHLAVASTLQETSSQ